MKRPTSSKLHKIKAYVLDCLIKQVKHLTSHLTNQLRTPYSGNVWRWETLANEHNNSPERFRQTKTTDYKGSVEVSTIYAKTKTIQRSHTCTQPNRQTFFAYKVTQEGRLPRRYNRAMQLHGSAK